MCQKLRSDENLIPIGRRHGDNIIRYTEMNSICVMVEINTKNHHENPRQRILVPPVGNNSMLRCWTHFTEGEGARDIKRDARHLADDGNLFNSVEARSRSRFGWIWFRGMQMWKRWIEGEGRGRGTQNKHHLLKGRNGCPCGVGRKR